MPHAGWAAGVLAAALVLTGCSDNSDPASAAELTPPPPAGAPTPAPAADVQPGVPFQISNKNGPTATVTLTAVEIDPECTTQFGARPTPAGTNTNVALEFDVTTTATPPTKWISEAWFDEETPDGYTRKISNSDDLCIADREDLATTWMPNSKYRGWVLVEVSNPASTLLMTDIWDGRPTPEVHRIPLPGA